MSVKIFDTHTLQTDVLFNTTTKPTTEEDDKNQQPPPAFHPDAPLRCARLHQSLPPQPYALEVSNQVREGMVLTGTGSGDWRDREGAPCQSIQLFQKCDFGRRWLTTR